jgi:hypothetical protein
MRFLQLHLALGPALGLPEHSDSRTPYVNPNERLSPMTLPRNARNNLTAHGRVRPSSQIVLQPSGC